jgi:hypothetical protein
MWSVEVEGRERGSEGLTYEKSGYEKRPSDNLTRPCPPRRQRILNAVECATAARCAASG